MPRLRRCATDVKKSNCRWRFLWRR